jgi:hypothetical protein
MSPNTPKDMQKDNAKALKTESLNPEEDSQASDVSKTKTSSLAIIALIMAFILPIVGFIAGIAALTTIKKNKQSGRGIAISAIVISSINTIIIAIIAIFIIIIAAVDTNSQQGLGDSGPGNVSITGEDGQAATIGENVSLPSGFPDDVPIYEPSDVVVATNSDGKYGVTLLTSDSSSKVTEYYTSELAKNGWTPKQGNGVLSFEGGSSILLEKDGDAISLFIITDSKKSGKNTNITIAVDQNDSN